ncbi:IclR family transcriptional regulator [Nakamurella endophytica]|uniref:Glycerol operon regulatory protein n=1 Tax=Nakamurella endophytica TaxID=1748367 RepID=A0A917SUP6_9ACTN|nr:IclR family transcriptional regulator [Nakamurella endophytica]GGL98652.1 IclR family transcriptional regulator [Nakamurella endophytica]
MAMDRTAPTLKVAAEPAGASVKSAARTIELLELLAQADRPVTLAEIHRALNYPKSSLHVLLRTLTACGWLQTDESATSYSIGVRALLAGTSYLEKDPVVQLAAPVLTALRDELDETVHLARLDRGDVVYLASKESAHHLRTSSRIGRRLPAYTCALGKALLAARTDAEVAGLVPDVMTPATDHTITDLPTLLADLAETRVRGWSLEHEENSVGLGCIAVTVPSRAVPRDAISCSVPLARFSGDRQRHIAETLARYTADLAASLRIVQR